MRAPVARSSLQALLLTDVVDSTALTARLGDARMAAIWAAHDRLARDLLPAFRGREFDRTDGFLLLFDAVADAVGWANQFHRALARLSEAEGVSLRARIGVHLGEVVLLENPAADVALGAKPVEVEGLAKPYAARIMSTAEGGQTLLSAEARAALGATPHVVVSHGWWRLKGVPEPVALFEAGDEDAPLVPPAGNDKVYRVVRRGDEWVPLERLPSRLPAERDAFFGRERDLRRLAEGVAESRCVTVTGPGGDGKTRLAVRFGHLWLGDFPGGAWFCDLTEARDPDGLVSAVAAALELPLGPQPIEQIGHALAARGRCLVILDNFEQVVAAAPSTLGRWLARCPEARFVVTSREVLRVQGERVLDLPALDADAAVALFLARARATGASIDDHEAQPVRRLVELLDRLPLAIELAAARARLLPPARILDRLGDRFGLLGIAGRKDRHGTLRATLDWSWELLEPAERAAFAQCSVFAGPFDLEDAEGVLDLSAVPGAASVLEVISALVDKSLVHRADADHLTLLVSARAYASGRLADPAAFPGSGLAAVAATERRHGEWYARLAQPGGHRTHAVSGREAMRRARVLAFDNSVAACRRAIARGDGTTAAATLESMWEVIDQRGPAALGAELAEAALALPGLPAPARFDVAVVATQAAAALGRRADVLRYLALVAEPAAPLDDHDAMVAALLRLFVVEHPAEPAKAVLLRELERARALGDPTTESHILGNLAVVAIDEQDPEGALARVSSALLLAQRHGDALQEGRLLSLKARVLRSLHRDDEARRACEEAIAVHLLHGHTRQAGAAWDRLAQVLTGLGRHAEGIAAYERALELYRGAGLRRLEAIAQSHLGGMYLTVGDLPRAIPLLERAVAWHQEHADHRRAFLQTCILAIARTRAGALDDAERALDDAWAARGDALPVTHRSQYESARAELATARGRFEEAAIWLAKVPDGVDPGLDEDVRHLRAVVQESLAAAPRRGEDPGTRGPGDAR